MDTAFDDVSSEEDSDEESQNPGFSIRECFICKTTAHKNAKKIILNESNTNEYKNMGGKELV
jgi:hypothetical protein